jgi:anti-anti-sigma factor
MTPPDDLGLGFVSADGVVTVTVAGEVDAVTGDEFSAALLDAVETSTTGVVVRMSAVTYFGSEGVRAIVDARNLAAERRRSLAVTDPSPVVGRLLKLVGLDGLVIREQA